MNHRIELKDFPEGYFAIVNNRNTSTIDNNELLENISAKKCYKIGLRYQTEKKYDKALKWYKNATLKAEHEKIKSSIFYYNLAKAQYALSEQAHLNANEYEQLLQASKSNYTDAITYEIDTKKTCLFYYMRGQVDAKLRHYESAQFDFKRAYDLASTKKNVYKLHYANMLFELGPKNDKNYKKLCNELIDDKTEVAGIAAVNYLFCLYKRHDKDAMALAKKLFKVYGNDDNALYKTMIRLIQGLICYYHERDYINALDCYNEAATYFKSDAYTPLTLHEGWLRELLRVQNDYLQHTKHAYQAMDMFPHDELIYDAKPVLGDGFFGKVFKAKWKDIEVAVKTIKSHELDDILDEYNLMSKLYHPQLVKFYGIAVDRQADIYALVMEYMPEGALSALLKNNQDTSKILSWQTRLTLAHDIAVGLEYLHVNKSIKHGDLKSANVILYREDNQLRAKLCDFGGSIIDASDGDIYGDIGTRGYQAPEIIRLEKYTNKADVYSYGIILWELAAQKLISSGTFSQPLPDDVPVWFGKLIARCRHIHRDGRPTMSEIARILKNELAKLTLTEEIPAVHVSSALQQHNFFRVRRTSELVPLVNSMPLIEFRTEQVFLDTTELFGYVKQLNIMVNQLHALTNKQAERLLNEKEKMDLSELPTRIQEISARIEYHQKTLEAQQTTTEPFAASLTTLRPK